MRTKFLFWLAILPFMGCGYALQSSKGPSELLEKENIHKIYIYPLKNNAFKPGLENMVYNELQLSIASSRRVELVSDPALADAVLLGAVESATASPTALTSSNSVFPTSRKTFEMPIATEYQATLNCFFYLKKKVGDVTTKTIWSSAFSRSKRFPGNNQKGEFGTTSPLINESEFGRALQDLTRLMMQEVNESMLALF